MAYTSIIPVSRLDNSITYIRNKDKTTKKGQSAGSLEEAIQYAMNRDKTERSIFENAGLSGGDSLFYQVLVGLVNTLTTILALLIIDKVGRKKLIYYGVSGMVVSLILIGSYFLFGNAWNISSLFLLAFFLCYVFCCAISICAVIFVLLSEMYPTKIRGLAMSIAGFALWIGTYLIGQLTPWMLQNLTPAGTFFLFAIMCVPYMLIVWKLVPETTGKSLEEIERYWTRSER
jgi:SP family arabinose:H+ symporter-like MFS transporter